MRMVARGVGGPTADIERLTILASQSCRDKQTGAVCDVTLSLDQWRAPKFDGSAVASAQ